MSEEMRSVLAKFAVLLAAVLVFWLVLSAKPPEAEAVVPYDVLAECQVLELTGDGMPDLVSCPGGESYTLVPFEVGR